MHHIASVARTSMPSNSSFMTGTYDSWTACDEKQNWIVYVTCTCIAIFFTTLCIYYWTTKDAFYLTLNPFTSGCSRSNSWKDLKKSARSTCLGATTNVSMSAPVKTEQKDRRISRVFHGKFHWWHTFCVNAQTIRAKCVHFSTDFLSQSLR